MRILVFLASTKRLGAIIDDKIVDLNLACAKLLADEGEPRPYALADAMVPTSLQKFIEGGKQSIEAANKAVDFAKTNLKTIAGPNGEKAVYGFRGVKTLTSLPGMGAKIFCMNENFTKLKTENPLPVTGFLSYTSIVIGPDDSIIYPTGFKTFKETKMLDCEVECAAIIGKTGKDIPLEKAKEHIFGYTVFTDIITRDFRGQADDNAIIQSMYTSENFDTSKAMGPCILTADQAKDIYNRGMEMRVNGTVRQSDTLKDMIHSFEEAIAYWSRDWTLHAGDVITSGSSFSTFRKLEGTRQYLKVGDRLEASIEGIGVLKNKVAKNAVKKRIAITED